jgi:hypothetical protein
MKWHVAIKYLLQISGLRWQSVRVLTNKLHCQGKHGHANDFLNMPSLMGLEFLLEWVFYKYIAPKALGFNSKLIR